MPRYLFIFESNDINILDDLSDGDKAASDDGWALIIDMDAAKVYNNGKWVAIEKGKHQEEYQEGRE